jgi:hypothetical protein
MTPPDFKPLRENPDAETGLELAGIADTCHCQRPIIERWLPWWLVCCKCGHDWRREVVA